MDKWELLKNDILQAGATAVGICDAATVETDTAFVEMCRMNSCGKYGKCWVCPPHLGEYEALSASLKEYERVLVYQTVSPLEDSFDFEGMTQAKKAHYKLSQRLQKLLPKQDVLHLSAGGCGLCTECTEETGAPCRYPENALAGLEAYGINVSRLAAAAGMNYINGENTVTYFGAVFFKD